MRFLGIRLDVEGRGLRFGLAVRRLIGMMLAAIPFGLGFLGIFFDERRRAWDDRMSRTDVLYEGNERGAAPWSRLDPEPALATPAAGTTKAPESRGLRSQRVVGSSPSYETPSGPSASL